MVTSLKSYRTRICKKCGKLDNRVRTDSSAEYCRKCASKIVAENNKYYSFNTRNGYSEYDHNLAHQYIRRWKKKLHICSICSSTKNIQFAYLGGYNRDLNNYIEMCPPCHYRFDRLRVCVIFCHNEWGEK